MFWNQDRVDQLFVNLSESFQPASLQEVFTFLAIVLLISSLLYYRSHKKNRLQAEADHLHKRRQFYSLCQKNNLDQPQIALLKEMLSAANKEPAGTEIFHKTYFEHIRDIYLQSLASTLDAETLQQRIADSISLQIEMNLSANRGKIYSTADLSTGDILRHSSNQFRIIEVQPEGFLISPIPETRPDFTLEKQEAVYTFSCQIMASFPDQNKALLRHTMVARKIQNRQYHRKNVNISGKINEIPCRIINLSAGGARIDYHGTLDNKQDHILSLNLDGHIMKCKVSIIHTRKSFYHVMYTEIREGQRDRIFKYLFQPAKRKTLKASSFALLIAAGIFLFLTNHLHAQSPAYNCDQYYEQNNHNIAVLCYQHVLAETEQTYSEENQIRPKAALSYMHLGLYRNSLDLLDSYSFSQTYLRIFAALKSGLHQRAAFEARSAIERSSFEEFQRQRITLLSGALLLESGEYAQSRQFFHDLSQQADDRETIEAATEIELALKEFENFPRKSPLLAGSMAAIFPGSGHWYAGHRVDGVMAFFWNSIFIGSAVTMYELERAAGRNHTASIITGAAGLLFYITNITGAMAAAERYNTYHERNLQERIRQQFFHVDFIERTSGIEFNSRF